MAINRIPPFESYTVSKDQSVVTGLQDTLILLSILEHLKDAPSGRFALATSDGIFQKPEVGELVKAHGVELEIFKTSRALFDELWNHVWSTVREEWQKEMDGVKAYLEAQKKQLAQAVDPEIPVFHAETLDDVLSSSLSVRRFSMEMVALFAATALLLAGLGIYGTISFLVHEQSREIAIRLALGAQRRDILKMVLRRGLTLAAVGAGVGLVGALIVSHLMAGLLYGVSPYDLSTFAGVTAVLTAVAIAASYVPALRAMRLDPITTLHAE